MTIGYDTLYVTKQGTLLIKVSKFSPKKPRGYDINNIYMAFGLQTHTDTVGNILKSPNYSAKIQKNLKEIVKSLNKQTEEERLKAFLKKIL